MSESQVCPCCGAVKEGKYFKSEDGTMSQVTIDHIKLWSLSLINKNNTNEMCHSCNSLRANIFAEQEDFINWFHSGEEELPARNFSYLHEQPHEIFMKYDKNTRKMLKLYLKVPKTRSEVKIKNYEKQINQHRSKSEQIYLYGGGFQKVTGDSTKVRTMLLNGFKYTEYHHPIYGKSLVKES